MKRFYKKAESGTAPGGFVVRLDGKVVRTPLQHPLIVPTAALAEALAAEWGAQGEEVVPASMQLNQLANTMIDKARGEDRAEMERTLAGYGASDLVCYFADHPAELRRRQEAAWGPLIAWMGEAFGIVLETVTGIQYREQPKEAARKIAALLSGMEPAVFTAAQAAAGAAGSLVIGLALALGRVSAEEAWQAACVDEIYQLEKWGEDLLARKRLDGIRAELEAAERFLGLVRA